MVNQNVIQTIADEYEIWINLQGFSIFLVWCFAGRAGCLMSVSYRLSNGYFYKIENIQQSSRGRDSVHSLRNENSSLRKFAGFKFYVEWYSCLINVGSSNTRCSTKSISVPRWRNLQFFNELINYCFIFPWQCGWSKPYNYIQNVVNLKISFMLRGWWPEFGEQMISATNTNLRNVIIMHIQKLTSQKHNIQIQYNLNTTYNKISLTYLQAASNTISWWPWKRCWDFRWKIDGNWWMDKLTCRLKSGHRVHYLFVNRRSALVIELLGKESDNGH